ncbi:MAG: hypothetical protein WCK36_04090, partial [Candidatus Firestonebacteria bacterium]
YGTSLSFLPFVNDFAGMLGGGKFGVGATAKIIQRYTATETKSILSLANFDPQDIIKKLANPQTGMGFDVAVNYNLPVIGSTFSLVGRDLFTTIGSDTVNSNWVFGYALQPNLIPGLPMTIALDVNDVFGNTTFMKKFCLGAEVDFIGIAVVRGGFYQGWSSFGVKVLGLIEYSNYGVERGLFAGNVEERFHRIAFTIGL